MDATTGQAQSNESRSTARSNSPFLRQRPLARAATFDGQPHPLLRRRSSVITETSFDDVRSRASTDNFFMPPRATGDDEDLRPDRSHWESLPLLFAIVPAVGGVFFKNGSQLATDFSLLALAAIYLNWCLRSPWDWYHSAQAVKQIDPSQLETIVEEGVDNDTLDDGAETLEAKAEAENREQDTVNGGEQNTPTDAEAAARELRVHELFALAACFIGPLFGAYLLHVVRSKLQTHLVGEGLVTNIHLTMFVLCAEIRPSRYLIKMIQARTLHLQRLIRDTPAPSEKIDKSTVQALMSRVDELEAAIADSNFRDVSADTRSTENTEMMKKIQGGLQAQIDPLNRAVRRYEKRTTAQAIQLEARLQNLESRLKEALSLAAVAANHSQKSSVVAPALNGITTLFVLPLQAALIVITYPLNIFNSMMERVLVKLRLKPRANAKTASSKAAKSTSRHASGGERGPIKTAKR